MQSQSYFYILTINMQRPKSYIYLKHTHIYIGFPVGSDSKESRCNTEDLGLILGQEDSLEKGMATHSNILA